jgi:WD40 repeat protein
MGVVYKARQVGLGRIVALKMILHAAYADSEQKRRFRGEAEAVARLQHPNVVQVYEVGEYGGVPYYSLEFCGGGSLDRQLHGTPWQAQPAARLVEILARAVHVAHLAGVVHRDLKPANVLLAEDGTPKLTDFGLAKRLDTLDKTASGAVVGTPGYMAPEQARGKVKDIGPSTDVYALGAILYELLSGRQPFPAANMMEVMERVLTEEPVALRKLQPRAPRDLETICHKCLHKDPRKRYVSALALADDLRRFLAREPVTARPVGGLSRAAKWARRRPTVAGLLALVGLVTAAGLAGVLWAYGEAVRERNLTHEAKDRADRQAQRAEDEAGHARREAQRADDEAARARDAARRADEEASKARRETQAARRARDESRLQAYFAQLGRVNARLQAGDFALAAARPESIQVLFPRNSAEPGVPAQEGAPRGLQHSDWVTAVTWSPDGTRFASASADTTVRIWDAFDGGLARTLRGHSRRLFSACYSPDGSLLASASEDGTVKVWDPRGGTVKLTLDARAGDVTAVCFSPDATHLAAAGEDGAIRIWDLARGEVVHELRGHSRQATSVAWSPDGTRLASASLDQTVRLWNPLSGEETSTLRGHVNSVYTICFSPDGSRLASGSGDQTIRVWDLRSRGRVSLTLRGHTNAILAVCFHPSGARLASASADQTVKVWDMRGGGEVATLLGHGGWVTSVCWSPDGTRLLSGGHDQAVRVWNARSSAGALSLRGHTDWVTAAACSPDGSRIASASLDGTVKVWEARGGAEVLTLRGHAGPVTAVGFSPNGTRLASASADQTVKIWDIRTGRRLRTLRGHSGFVTSVCFHPTGTLLASGSADQTVRVWDVGGGAEVLALRGLRDVVTAVVYSPDGTRLVGASWKTALVWDPSGKEVGTLSASSAMMAGVRFNRDGSRIVAPDASGQALVWDAPRARPLPMVGLPERLPPAYASPDGRWLALAEGDLVRLYLLSTAAAGDGPWVQDDERRRILAPAWHAEDAAEAEAAGDAFAAAFHRARLAELRPSDRRNWLALEQACVRRADARPALAVCDRLLEEDPGLAPIYLQRARLRLALGDRPGANTDVLAALAQVPTRPHGWPEYAHGEAEAGAEAAARDDWGRARGHFALAALLHSAQRDYLRRLALAELAAGDAPAARRTSLRLFRDFSGGRDPELPLRLSGILSLLTAHHGPGSAAGAIAAEALLRRQPLQQAEVLARALALPAAVPVETGELLALARRSLECDPQSWEPHELLGAALLRAGDPQEAVRELQKAVRLHGGGGSAWAHLFLALAHRRLGQDELCRQAVEGLTAPANWEEKVIQQQLLGQLGPPGM